MFMCLQAFFELGSYGSQKKTHRTKNQCAPARDSVLERNYHLFGVFRIVPQGYFASLKDKWIV